VARAVRSTVEELLLELLLELAEDVVLLGRKEAEVAGGRGDIVIDVIYLGG
jgi:hypothetical protein